MRPASSIRGARPGPAVLLGVVGLFTACRVLPHDGPPEPSTQAPPTWSASAPSGAVDPDHTWWAGFGDSGLEKVIDEALVANLDLAGSAARMRQAAAQARIAGADRLPTLDVGGNGGRAKTIFVGLPIPGGGDVLESLTTTVGVSLDVAWELDLWGRLAAQEEAGATLLAAAVEDYRAARHSVAAQTAKAWFAWREVNRGIALAKATSASFQRTLELTQRRFERGLASALDVRLAAGSLAAARVQEAARRDDQERVVRQLELLLGRYPSGTLAIPEGRPTLPPLPAAGLPSELVARRPDLAAAELRLLAADDNLYAARAALYPSLRLTGSLGRTSNRTGDLLDSDFSIWSLAGGLTQPLFRGGLLRANVDLNNARVQEALVAFESALLTAFGEVETALIAEVRLGALEERTRELVEASKAASELAQQRYEAGLADILDLLETQRRELDAEGQLIAVQTRRRNMRVDLHLALGGGFEVPVPSETHP